MLVSLALAGNLIADGGRVTVRLDDGRAFTTNFVGYNIFGAAYDALRAYGIRGRATRDALASAINRAIDDSRKGRA